jgi:hypothetical protein
MSKADRQVEEAAARILEDSRDEQDRALRVAALTTAINVTPPGAPNYLAEVLARAMAFNEFITGAAKPETVH